MDVCSLHRGAVRSSPYRRLRAVTLMLRDAQPETRGENVKQQEMRGGNHVNDEAEELDLTKTLATKPKCRTRAACLGAE